MKTYQTKSLWRFHFVLMRAESSAEDPRSRWVSRIECSARGQEVELLCISIAERLPYPTLVITILSFKLGIYYAK